MSRAARHDRGGRASWQRRLRPKGTCRKKKTSFTEIGEGLYAFTAEGFSLTALLLGVYLVSRLVLQGTGLLAVAVLILFPGIVLWLPSLI